MYCSVFSFSFIKTHCAHLMTTSKNLFQSIGLKRLKCIERPLISLMMVLWTSQSLSCFSSSYVSLMSRMHFSIRL